MKLSLQQLLPADISDETTFHLVKFFHGLSLALESIYFDQMLSHTSECEHDPFAETSDDENGAPF